MMVLYLGQTGGQVLLGILPLLGNTVWLVITSLCLLSILPVMLLSNMEPLTLSHKTTPHISLSLISKLPKIGIAGCLVAGLMLGMVYGLLPVYAAGLGLSQSDIGWVMGSVLLGAVALQFPVGWLSDSLSRIVVLSCVAIGLTLITGLLCFEVSFITLCLLMFCWGGGLFTLRPLTLGYSCDGLANGTHTLVSRGLILIYSLGAIIGPLEASLWITRFGSLGFMVHSLIILLFFLD